METIKVKRIQYIDMFRGIGILLMIMGHVYFGDLFDKYIHGFHMPMFYFASGYFYKPVFDWMSYRKKIKRIVHSLLLPYMFFACISITILIIKYGISCKVFSLVVFNTSENGLPYFGALWFLTSLFFLEVIYITIQYVFNRNSIITTMVTVLSVIGFAIANLKINILPFGTSASLIGLPFFHLAYIIKNGQGHYMKYFRSLDSIPPFFCIALLLIASVLIQLNGAVNMRTGEYCMQVLFFFNAVIYILGLWNLCRFFTSKFENKAIDSICYIGCNSIVFLCLNQSYIAFVSKMTAFILDSAILSHLLTLVVVTLLLYLTAKIVLSTRLKTIFGQTSNIKKEQ